MRGGCPLACNSSASAGTTKGCSVLPSEYRKWCSPHSGSPCAKLDTATSAPQPTQEQAAELLDLPFSSAPSAATSRRASPAWLSCSGIARCAVLLSNIVDKRLSLVHFHGVSASKLYNESESPKSLARLVILS